MIAPRKLPIGWKIKGFSTNNNNNNKAFKSQTSWATQEINNTTSCYVYLIPILYSVQVLLTMMLSIYENFLVSAS